MGEDMIITWVIIVAGIGLLISGAIYAKHAKVKKKVYNFLKKFSCCG